VRRRGRSFGGISGWDTKKRVRKGKKERGNGPHILKDAYPIVRRTKRLEYKGGEPTSATPLCECENEGKKGEKGGVSDRTLENKNTVCKNGPRKKPENKS